MFWADQLVYGGYDDWRLPKSNPLNGTSYVTNFSFNGLTDVGYNITSPNSELAYLWYVTLGNNGAYYPNGSLNYDLFNVNYPQNSGPFLNLGGDNYGFWTSADLNQFGTFWFNVVTGNQNLMGKANGLRAWAVRDGDVEILATIAEPGVLALLFLGSSTPIAFLNNNPQTTF